MTRSRFQGLRNVVAFNWPFYALGMVVALISAAAAVWILPMLGWVWWSVATLTIALSASSLVVSLWVYDLSDLYELPWLQTLSTTEIRSVAALNAGFDEVSGTLRERLPEAECQLFDFYDPITQTEASIERARRSQGTDAAHPVSVTELPLEDGGLDLGVAFMSAHEIRDTPSRIALFRELRRSLSPGGKVVVVEHLRDWANFLAYNVGFFHFLSRRVWLHTFREAGLEVEREISQTPFVTAFILKGGADS